MLNLTKSFSNPGNELYLLRNVLKRSIFRQSLNQIDGDISIGHVGKYLTTAVTIKESILTQRPSSPAGPDEDAVFMSVSERRTVEEPDGCRLGEAPCSDISSEFKLECAFNLP